MQLAISGEHYETGLRRLVYVGALALGCITVLATWIEQRTISPYVAVFFPPYAVFLAAVAGGLAIRRLGVRTAERAVLVGIAIYHLTQIAYVMQTAPDLTTARLELAESGFLGMSILFMVAYLAFETARALRVCLVILSVFLVLMAGRVVPTIFATGGYDEAFAYMRVSAYLVAALGLLHLLAQAKEQLARSKSTAETLEALAHTDALTGLGNRRHLLRKLDGYVEAGGPFAVVLLDLDGFKAINDQFGHDCGDEVLRWVGARLQNGLRATDVLGRWGGEEFLILVPHTDLKGGLDLAERCRHLLVQQPHDTVGAVTASFGVASYQPGDTTRGLLQRADEAAYQAKHEGRNRVVAVSWSERLANP